MIENDMTEIIKQVSSKDPYVRGRDKVALLLIGLFGLRVCNIKLIKVSQIETLTKGKPVSIPLLKDNSKALFRLVPCAKILAWLWLRALQRRFCQDNCVI